MKTFLKEKLLTSCSGKIVFEVEKIETSYRWGNYKKFRNQVQKLIQKKEQKLNEPKLWWTL